MKIGLQLLWLPKTMRREGQIQNLPDYKWCDSGTVPIWKWETTIWVLSFNVKTKLIRFTREGTYIYDTQKKIFLQSWPPKSHIDMRSKFNCEKNFCQLKNWHISVQSSFSIPHENMRLFSGGHRKVTACSGLSKNHNWKKKGLFQSNFAFLMLVL